MNVALDSISSDEVSSAARSFDDWVAQCVVIVDLLFDPAFIVIDDDLEPLIVVPIGHLVCESGRLVGLKIVGLVSSR